MTNAKPLLHHFFFGGGEWGWILSPFNCSADLIRSARDPSSARRDDAPPWDAAPAGDADGHDDGEGHADARCACNRASAPSWSSKFRHAPLCVMVSL